MASISGLVRGKRPNAMGRDVSVTECLLAVGLAVGLADKEAEEEERAGCMCSRLSRTRAEVEGRKWREKS
jgi:hypothetical protein